MNYDKIELIRLEKKSILFCKDISGDLNYFEITEVSELNIIQDVSVYFHIRFKKGLEKLFSNKIVPLINENNQLLQHSKFKKIFLFYKK